MTPRTHDACQICGNTAEWHVANHSRHTFVPPGVEGGMAQLGPSNKERSMLPGHRSQSRRSEGVKLLPGLPTDPTLRVLLLRKGLITAEELSETEDEIRRTREEGGIVIVSAKTEGPVDSDGSDLRPRDGGGS